MATSVGVFNPTKSRAVNWRTGITPLLSRRICLCSGCDFDFCAMRLSWLLVSWQIVTPTLRGDCLVVKAYRQS
jgi:hypothetical protein